MSDVDGAQAFLRKGGELGGLIAAYDWSKTPIGPIEAWPQYLKTTVSLFLQSPMPIVSLWGESGVMIYNDAYSAFAGERHPVLLGSNVREGWPEVADFNDNVMKVGLSGGTLSYEDQELVLNRTGKFEQGWMDLAYSPVLDDAGKPAGVIAIVVETTAKVKAERWLNGERDRLARMFEEAPGIMALLEGPEHRFQLANAAYQQLIGHRDVVGRPIAEALPELAGQGFFSLLDQVYETGEAFRGYGATVSLQRQPGQPREDRLVDFVYQPIKDAEGRTTGIFVEGSDVTDRNIAEQGLREEKRALELLNSAGSNVAADLDLDSVVQTVTDAGVALTGAEFGAFFYNVLDAGGESYMLYSISGVPREAFSQFPMPRNTAVFAPTFSGEGVVRSDDITQDPRYGHNSPRQGMPEGHLPVRSYLAVPVKSRTGEVLGGLFFGHSEVGRFGERTEGLLGGLAGQAAIAIDNSRLFQAAQAEIARRQQAEQELQALNATLEQKVAEEVENRLRAEDALRQAQKMEAVGQLTGGVAHDFNNLLTVIIGGLDTVKRAGDMSNPRLARAVDMASQGAQRAATLTARLLAFSRRQPLAPQATDLNITVREMTELLHRTLGEQIELEGVLSSRLWTVEVDKNQLESAILNLAVNARDAMPEGGKLTIETANTMLDESYAAVDAEVAPGQYVMLAITDSGEGMSKGTLARVFEPFFTTKDVGRGTGLGLSMVYGFVKQSGGHVGIYSEEGEGTTVKLYFPRFHGTHAAASQGLEAAVPLGQKGEVVLVVEDNDDVREFSVNTLSDLGYTVLHAIHADAALQILQSQARIDLLFTDVVLPGRTGRVLADEAALLRPGLKVLFTTGYSRNAIVHQGRLDAGVRLLTKPFTLEQLATQVRDVLDS